MHEQDQRHDWLRGSHESGTPPARVSALGRYGDYLDQLFIHYAECERLTFLRGDQWLSGQRDLASAGDELLAGARYAPHRHEAIVRVGETVAHLTRGKENLTANIAGRSPAAVDETLGRLREAFPEIDTEGRHETELTFWWQHEGLIQYRARCLEVPAWKAIRANYGQRTAAALGGLHKLQQRPNAGRLLLWHGTPGGGKTTAIRSLSWEWREWCDFHYVTDPDALFGTSPGYMVQFAMEAASDGSLDESDGGSTSTRARCLVLEDTGELLAADAKAQSGQALSRFLNVVDGLIGQGLNLIVLVTTNEPLRRLHPAVARYGRCLAEIEFAPLPVEQANEWLGRRGSQAQVPAPTPLAELYGMLAGHESSSHEREFGFAA